MGSSVAELDVGSLRNGGNVGMHALQSNARYF